MRQLAYIETIKNLKDIPGADAIECSTVLGWEIVIHKGEFSVGDKVILCEIDSILPDLPPFDFLRGKRFRIKTCKMRGCTSQGIVFPLSVINQVKPDFDITTLKVGDDVTDLLGITKYDPESALDIAEPEQAKKSWLANKLSYYKWKLLGIKKVKSVNGFPSHLVPKTDETRVQKMGPALEAHAGELAYITEKCEGTSCTFLYRKTGNWLARLFKRDGVFQICSRNQIIYNSQGGRKPAHNLVTVEVKYNIEQKLRKLGRNIAIQGECIGGKIQGNLYKLPELELRVFLAYDIDKQEYLNFNQLLDLVNELDLEMVPIVASNVEIVNDIKYYVELSKGQSNINPKVMREGIVVRSQSENFSFKSINPEYLLKQG